MVVHLRLLLTAVFVIPLFAACRDDDDGGSSSTPPTSSTSSSRFCYLAKDKGSCECVAVSEDSSRPSADWSKVSACNSSTVGASLVCSVDTKVDGTTTSCSCAAIGCKEEGGRCTCGSGYPSSTITSCTKSYEWCCARNDSASCYCSNGNFGSACGNDEKNVKTCVRSDVKTTTDEKSNCDGLRFVAPPPSPPSSGGGSGGCKSSSECLGKCSTRCYDCRSGSCACGRIGSSGSCIY